MRDKSLRAESPLLRRAKTAISALTVLLISSIVLVGCSSTTASRNAGAAEESDIQAETNDAGNQQQDVQTKESDDAHDASQDRGEPWVVSMGDSFISGEAGRWAGNETWSTKSVDALGGSAYFDGPSGELINRCHRSKSAAIHIGTVQSKNFACSGAITSTKFDSDGNFKPGIDFYNEGGNKGQALMLQEFAQTNNVKLVALSIGGNDFKFAPTIEACIKSFLKPSVFGSFCSKQDSVTSAISTDAVNKVREDTKQAILNIATAMENAGYKEGDWAIGLQLYPNVVSNSSSMRYKESGYNRQLVGGCGFRNDDVNWALETVLPLINKTFKEAGAQAEQARPGLNLVVLDSSEAFTDRGLCEKSVQRVQADGGASNWTDANAVDVSEWVMEINMVNPNDTYSQESLHPNYWGQLALRSCWRQIWNDGDVQSGKCTRSGNGLNNRGEPVMALR